MAPELNRSGAVADEISGADLPRKMRGYAVDAVDELLARLASRLEQAEKERDALRRRVREAEARLAAALEAESTLKRRLVAQQAAEGQLEEARQEAAELRAAAEGEALRRLEDADTKARQLLDEAREAVERERLAAAIDRAESEPSGDDAK